MTKKAERGSEMGIENTERVGKDHGEDRGRPQRVQPKDATVSRRGEVLAVGTHEKQFYCDGKGFVKLVEF